MRMMRGDDASPFALSASLALPRSRSRSRSFRVNFGNSSVRMIYGGKRYSPANIGQPIGYELRPGKKPKRLKESVRTGLCAT